MLPSRTSMPGSCLSVLRVGPGQGLGSGGIVDGRIPADNHGDTVAPHLYRGDLPFVLGQIHVDIADEIFASYLFEKGL